MPDNNAANALLKRQQENNALDLKVCRICLETDTVEYLISPCYCKGSIKYVHPHCMAGWRKTLLETGRESDLYHCQLCKQRLYIKQKRLYAALLHYRIIRVVVAVLILALILIPAGNLMKAFIHFSVLLTNHPGGLVTAWKNNAFMKLLFSTSQTSLLSSFASSATIINSSTNSTYQLLYAPFPVCFAPSNSNKTHALLSSELLYYFLFPFTDERLWQLILCKLEHFHLGFFLLGSLNNIYFTYKILNDMFDIVLLGQVQQQLQHEDDNNDVNEADTMAKRMCRLLKGFLLVYCCSLVVLFWIHFNIFAFHIDSSQSAYTSRQFIAELPLWILRWVTLGIAVVDFTARGIYSWLSRYSLMVDQEDVLSLPENVKHFSLFF